MNDPWKTMQTEDLNKSTYKENGTRDSDSPSRTAHSRCEPNLVQRLATTTPNREALHYPMNEIARISTQFEDGAKGSLERENSGFSV